MRNKYIFDEEMLHMSETKLESLRIRARRREKAMSLEKYKLGIFPEPKHLLSMQ